MKSRPLSSASGMKRQLNFNKYRPQTGSTLTTHISSRIKDNNSVDEYFKDITIDNYEFNDIDHTLTLHYRNDLIIVTFDEMKDFLDDLGYTCVEGTYEE